MKSFPGVLAASTLLLGLPVAVLSQMLFGAGVETMIHLLFGGGLALISLSVFDFKIPRWMNWIGCAAASALAIIFLLQGLSELTRNESLTHFAFQVLGQGLERVLPDLLLAWLVALLLIDSRGWTRILGFVAMSIAVSAEAYSYASPLLGAAAPESLKPLLLLPFVWFLVESKKKTSPEARS